MKKQTVFFLMLLIFSIQAMAHFVPFLPVADAVDEHNDACDITILPYSENFDATPTGQRPLCWTGFNNMGNTFPQVFSGEHYSGNNSLYFNGNIPSPYCMIVSPEIVSSIPLSSLQVTFMLHIATTSPYFIVGVVTDITDASSFVPVDTIIASAISTWESHTVNFLEYSGTGQRIAFKLCGAARTCLDDIVIDYAQTPSCLPVDNLAADSLYYDNTNTGTAVLTWTSANTGTNSYILEYKSAISSTWNTINVNNATTYTLTGLLVNTNYDVRVAVQCDTSTSVFRSISFSIVQTLPCLVPENLVISNISSSSAVASWTAGGSETSWILEYKIASASNYSTVPCLSSSYTFSNLTPSTAYDVRVKAVCDSTNFSDYTTVANFTTTNIPITTYTITASCGSHGTVSPNGVQNGCRTHKLDIHHYA